MDIVSILKENWAVIESAPLAAIALLLLGGSLGYLLNSRISSGVSKTLKERVAHRDDLISDLREKLEAVPAAKISGTSDPDAIIQRGVEVGRLRKVDFCVNEGFILAAELQGSDKFNPSNTFKFRDYTLKLAGSAAQANITMPGFSGSTYHNARCEIVDD